MEPEKYVTCMVCRQIFNDAVVCPCELDGLVGAACGSCAAKISDRSKKAAEEVVDADEDKE